MLTLCIVGNTWAKIPVQTWTDGKEVGYNGTFYLYNIGAERYLSRGNQYNTHAVLEGGGLEVTIEDFNNSNDTKTGKLHTNVTGGLGHYVYLDGGNGVYVDGNNALVFTFEEISGWGYTHAYLLKCTKDNTTYYLGWAGGGAGATSNEVVASTSHNQSYNFLWLLIDKDDRKLDYTTKITHPDFEGGYNSTNYDENNILGWSQQNGNHSHSTYTGFWKQTSSQNFTKATFAEKWNSSAPLAEDDIYQTISVPEGKYTLIVDAKATNLGNPSTDGVFLYLNNDQTRIGAEGKYQVTTTLQSEGSLRLGVKIVNGNDANWVAFDNVRLFKDDGEEGSYQKIGNTLTFTGAGNLLNKVYEMDNYTVILGNDKEDGEHPNVKAIPNGKFGAYVVDRNGYEFAFIQNNFPMGFGTYYTVKPKADGRLKITVNGSNGNLPLVIVDSKGNIKKVIPGYEYVKGDVTEIDCGVVLNGETYYFFTRCQEVNGNYNWGTLYLQKTEFTPFTSPYQLVVESNDFDQYCEQEGEHIWVANTTLDCTVAVDAESPLHGPYAYYNPGNTNDRSVYYPFEELGARQRYKLEFDAWVKPGDGKDHSTQIALYRTKPGNNAKATDYLMAIEIPRNGGTWDFKVPTGLDANNNCTYSSVLSTALSNETWYHFIVDVDARTPGAYKIGVQVTADNDHSDVKAHTNGQVNFTGNYQALGISYLAGRYNNQAKFDNILITSNQGPIGTVTAPTIAVTGYQGKSRTVTITSGYSDEKPVKTYYEYADITTIEEQYVGDNDQEQTRTVAYNWDYILRKSTWTAWPNPFETANAKEQATTSFTLSPAQNDVPKVYFVRAISTIEDYAVVRSDTAYLRVEVGKLFTPTGGFAVQEMKQIDGSNYWTPVVRAYFDATILGNDADLVEVTIDYKPLDYGINTDTGEDVPTTPDWVTIKSGTGNTFTPDATNGTRYVDIDLTGTNPNDGKIYHSGIYRIHISCGSKLLPFDLQKNYYKDKYKITYQTPDFGDVNGPIQAFEKENSKYMNASNTTVSNRIYGYTPWDFWTMTSEPKALDGWNSTGITTYYWNTSHSGTTATLNSVSSAQSSASTQTYDIRTIQYDTKNPIVIQRGWGIVKDSNIPWNYRCGLAHIGMGNEIPEFTIDDGKGGAHHTFKVYPTPYITGSNVPECNYSVPVRCALKQYKVYTPVETKKVNGKTGLASLSSYYALYSVQDYYMDNDELVGTFFAPNHNGFGSIYYLLQTWYVWKRHGVLLAANQYITADSKKDIWTGYKDFVDSKAWDEQDKTVELRIIDYDFVGQPGKTFSMVGNELKPILLNNDVEHNGNVENEDYCMIKGSSGGNTGRPNMILYKGKRNGEDTYNFYCLPTADTTAKMANKTAYIQRQGCTYAQYAQNNTVKENGEKIMLVNGTYDDEAVGIDIVENNADMQRIEDGVFYNLAGQKVSTPTKGIYILNGRKVLVK